MGHFSRRSSRGRTLEARGKPQDLNGGAFHEHACFICVPLSNIFALSPFMRISFMTRILPSSTRSKKYNSTTEKPQCEFSFLHLSSFENVCFFFSPSKPYALPLPPPSAPSPTASPSFTLFYSFALRRHGQSAPSLPVFRL